MNPLLTDGTKQRPDPGPNATALPTPSRPLSPAPKVSGAVDKAARSTLLTLNLKRLDPKTISSADSTDTAPASPSSRSKTKVGRSITEKQGHKRAHDDMDGPGLTAEKPGKRQRGSTPPGSPRGSNSPLKQMVKSSRAVQDLSTLAGDARRRQGTSSPPSSPRAELTAQPSVMASPGRARTDSSLPAKAAAALTGSAPTWRSTSEPGMPDTKLFLPRSRPAHADGDVMSAKAGLSLPAQTASAGRPRSPDADLAEFTFAECDYGEEGELVLTPRQVSSAIAPAAPSGATVAESTALSIAMIQAELLPKAKLQREAATAYRASLYDLMRLADSEKNIDPAPGMRVLASAFRTAQDDLEAEMMVIEIALGGASSADLAIYLGKVIDRIAACTAVIASSTTLAPAVGTSAAVALASPALSTSLDAMVVACKVGIAMLMDERAASSASAATSSAPQRQGFLVSTPSNQALLDDLDALMDEEIRPARAGAAVKAPAKEQ